jgi:hypothetical protein
LILKAVQRRHLITTSVRDRGQLGEVELILLFYRWTRALESARIHLRPVISNPWRG